MLHFLHRRIIMSAFDVLMLRLEESIWLVKGNFSPLLCKSTTRLGWVHALEPVGPACALGTLQERLHLSATSPGTGELVGAI